MDVQMSFGSNAWNKKKKKEKIVSTVRRCPFWQQIGFTWMLSWNSSNPSFFSGKTKVVPYPRKAEYVGTKCWRAVVFSTLYVRPAASFTLQHPRATVKLQTKVRKVFWENFGERIFPLKMNWKINGTIRKCSRAFQWMVMSVGTVLKDLTLWDCLTTYAVSDFSPQWQQPE
jgi:hypothetical protein